MQALSTNKKQVILNTWLSCILLISFISCDDNPQPNPTDLPAGETTAGETTAGEITAGETTAGETTAGETTAGETTAGETTAGETTAGEMPILPDVLPQEGSGINGNANLDLSPPNGLRVGFVDEEDEIFEGQDIACRLGSVRIENNLVTACLQGDSSLTQFKRRGGNLVDFMSWASLGIDGLSELIVAPGFGELIPQEIKIMSEGGEGQPAIVQVRAVTAGSRILTSYLPSYVPRLMNVTNEYHLYEERKEIEVHTWIEVGDRAISLQLSDFIIWADPTRLFYPNQEGERIPPQAAYLGAHLPKVSYVWRVEDSDRLRVTSLPGLPFQPITAKQAEAPAHSILYIKRILLLGEGGVSPVAERFLTATPDLKTFQLSARLIDSEGQVINFENNIPFNPQALLNDCDIDVYTVNEEGGLGLHIAQNRLKLDASETAELAFKLAPGEYWLRADEWVGGTVQKRITITETEATLNQTIDLPAPALLSLSEGYLSLNDEPLNPQIRGSKWIFTPQGESTVERQRVIHFVLENNELLLPAGAWRLQVSRGWHFGLEQQTLNLQAGERLELNINLKEELPFDGWSAGEFHQHSAPSLDSLIDYKTRIISNIAEGVGFMVPSDHDVMADYPTMVHSFGFNNDIGAPITGLEISPRAGHLGAYGITYSPNDESGAGGAPPLSIKVSDGGGEAPDTWRLRTIPELIVEARSRGAEIIQVNHPRDSTGYFDTVGFDPNLGTTPTEHEQWTADFDTVEVFNGASDFCAVMHDWQSLLLQGERITAVGNSDSHSLGRPVGYPRNYLPTEASQAIQITKVEIVDALKHGRVSIGGGAYLKLGNGITWGDTLLGGTHNISLSAHTPSFAQLTQVSAYFNGQKIWETNLDSPLEALNDFEGEIPISVDSDGFLIFFAEGPNLNAVHEGQPTFALGNPLWIDADANGSVELPSPFVAPTAMSTAFCR